MPPICGNFWTREFQGENMRFKNHPLPMMDAKKSISVSSVTVSQIASPLLCLDGYASGCPFVPPPGPWLRPAPRHNVSRSRRHGRKAIVACVHNERLPEICPQRLAQKENASKVSQHGECRFRRCKRASGRFLFYRNKTNICVKFQAKWHQIARMCPIFTAMNLVASCSKAFFAGQCW